MESRQITITLSSANAWALEVKDNIPFLGSKYFHRYHTSLLERYRHEPVATLSLLLCLS